MIEYVGNFKKSAWARPLLKAGYFLLAGLLLSFAMPFRAGDFIRNPSWFSIFIASIGLLLFLARAAKARKARWRILGGFLTGFVYYTITLYWVTTALKDFGDIHISLALIGMLMLTSYCALYYGAWAGLVGSSMVRKQSPFVKALLWASSWTALDAFRQFFLTGFPWAELGFAFSFSPSIAQTASLWGVHGLTFVWVFIFSLVILFDQWTRDKQQKKYVAISISIIFILGILGMIFPRPSKEFIEKNISIIQPNISQEIKWDPSKANTHLRELIDLSVEATKQNSDLIIWPETSFPFLIGDKQKQLPFSSSTPLLIGGVVREAGVNKNSSLLMYKDQIQQRFDKIHLVPFGEYVPLKNIIPFGKLVQNVGDFVKGKKDQLVISLLDEKMKIGPLICYEDIFSQESVRHARKGANLLINQTNDAWYGHSSEQKQHALMASMQVYQTGLPMVRATNDGLSSFIMPHSRIEAPQYQRIVQTEKVKIPLHPSKTFFVWSYPLMEWIWIIIFGIAIALCSQNPRTRKIFFRD